jgi:uncharacterized protein (DUF983 family)
MRKLEAICFECGFRYNKKVLNQCPKCGDERTFIAALHSADYDIAKDPEALFKLRIYGVMGFLSLLITVMNLTH